MMSTKKVLITGFGPFPNVDKNLSWESVNAMSRDDIERKYNVRFYQEQIDVAYKTVDGRVPKLWAKLQPNLTIHVGVKGNISGFLLETQADKERYDVPDINGTCPVDYRHCVDGPDTIVTDLDVDHVCQEFNRNPPAEGLTAEKSCDAGKYLCEYTYYTSLACRGCSKTLFVHVPFNSLSIDHIAEGLERILEICLEQMGDC